MLNKFAIVPEHFILATQAFAPQTDLLEAADLEAAYACVAAYDAASAGGVDGAEGGAGGGKEGRGGADKDEEGARQGGGEAGEKGEGLFAFFNSGDASGASQPHRHIQLLPVQRMRDGLGAGERWDVLARSLRDGAVRERLPFRVFAAKIDAGMDGPALRAVYLRLYRQACEAMGVEVGERDRGEARISYNLAMTREVMVLMPRAVEGAEVMDGEGTGVGRLALNGTVLAGTALVKTQREWDALRADPGQVARVLGRIGVGREGKL